MEVLSLPMALNESIYIYGLFDPITCHLRYIGKSINPEKRLRQHIKESELGTTHKDNWIRKLVMSGMEPTIEILDKCTKKSWKKTEKEWIRECRKNKVDLVNVLEGGSEPPNIKDLLNKDEIIEKMSRTRKAKGIKPPGYKGMKHSEKTKKQQSKSISAYYKEHDHPFKGKSLSSEHRDNIIKARKDKGIFNKSWMDFVTDERRKEIFNNRSNNKEWRKNLSNAAKERLKDPTKNNMYGKNHSEESKEKID